LCAKFKRVKKHIVIVFSKYFDQNGIVHDCSNVIPVCNKHICEWIK